MQGHGSRSCPDKIRLPAKISRVVIHLPVFETEVFENQHGWYSRIKGKPELHGPFVTMIEANRVVYS